MSCHPRVTEWTTILRAHLPHLTKSQATVLALWSLGMVLARSCALTAVSMFLATWLHRKEDAVRQQWREFCYEATAKGGDRAPRAGRRDGLCAVVGLGRGPVGGHPIGPGPGCDDPGHPLYRVGAQRGLSGWCHPGGLDGPGGHGQTCLAPGVVAHVAPGAPGAPTGLDGPCPGGSGLGRPLAVSAHDAAGVAPVFAHQHRGHVSSHGSGARGPSEDVGARARDDVAGHRHRLHRPQPAAALYVAGVLGSGLHRSLVCS